MGRVNIYISKDVDLEYIKGELQKHGTSLSEVITNLLLDLEKELRGGQKQKQLSSADIATIQKLRYFKDKVHRINKNNRGIDAAELLENVYNTLLQLDYPARVAAALAAAAAVEGLWKWINLNDSALDKRYVYSILLIDLDGSLSED
ncbi:hypothetical protein [Archaeoglobus sulfaticallidus]|nr:hypothetical protein [Archaeoglobus sulfaticallidus]